MLTTLIRLPFQVNGVAKAKLICTEKALLLPAPRKQKNKDLDTIRYARAEVKQLSIA